MSGEDAFGWVDKHRTDPTTNHCQPPIQTTATAPIQTTTGGPEESHTNHCQSLPPAHTTEESRKEEAPEPATAIQSTATSPTNDCGVSSLPTLEDIELPPTPAAFAELAEKLVQELQDKEQGGGEPYVYAPLAVICMGGWQ